VSRLGQSAGMPPTEPLVVRIASAQPISSLTPCRLSPIYPRPTGGSRQIDAAIEA